MSTLRTVLSSALFLLVASPAPAATIGYAVTNLGGNSWRYDYTISNDSLASPLEEFTVYFSVASYANLAVAASPAEWDSLVVQPDAGLPDDGFLDSLALGSGLAPDATLAGFAVTFDYLGAGLPGPQSFVVVNPDTFAVLESGTTTVVPAPGGAILIGTALLALVPRLRPRSDRQ